MKQVKRERAEVTLTNRNSAYRLDRHKHPRIIEINNDYVASTNGEPTISFDCLCCKVWYIVSKKDIEYRSAGFLEPDLVHPDRKF